MKLIINEKSIIIENRFYQKLIRIEKSIITKEIDYNHRIYQGSGVTQNFYSNSDLLLHNSQNFISIPRSKLFILILEL